MKELKVSPPISGRDLDGDELHTEDIQEIITKVPSWILRRGIMVFFGILLMIAAIGSFVRYPDTIKESLKFQSTGISVPVIAMAPGIISKVFVKQGVVVKRGQPLAKVAVANTPIGYYTLTAPQDGNIGFITVVQQGSVLSLNQPVFVVHPSNEQFFGLMEIPAATINKIKKGQQVLINLKNYPAEEYGQLKGIINYVTDEPNAAGFFTVKVTLNNSGLKQPIQLKSWMMGDANIVTKNVSVERRIFKSIFIKL
jgi:multidrug resistance efflux pump